MNPSQYLKAVYAAVVAGLGSLAAVLVNGEKISAVSASQWVTVVIATVIAGGAVYGVTNAPATPKVGGHQ
jgi:hypothetical protein